jgi:hypothetical protein
LLLFLAKKHQNSEEPPFDIRRVLVLPSMQWGTNRPASVPISGLPRRNPRLRILGAGCAMASYLFVFLTFFG